MFHPVFKFSPELFQAFRLGLVDSLVLDVFRLRHRSMIGHDSIEVCHLIRWALHHFGFFVWCTSSMDGCAWSRVCSRCIIVIACKLFPKGRRRRLICWNRYWVGVCGCIVNNVNKLLIGSIFKLVALLSNVTWLILWTLGLWVLLQLLLILVWIFFYTINCF